MFKKHKLEVKMVKEDPDILHYDPKRDIEQITENIATTAVFVLGAYFLGDTLRGVITHIVVTKVK